MIIFDKQKIEIYSNLKNVRKIEDFIDEICDYFNVHNDYFGNILVAVTEAVNNAIVHGNQSDESKKVTVIFEAKDGNLTFAVLDQGYGFDYRLIPDPTDPASDGIAGRGLYLMNHLTDEIEFNEKGNGVKLKFAITSINNSMATRRIEEFNKYVEEKKVEEKKDNKIE